MGRYCDIDGIVKFNSVEERDRYIAELNKWEFKYGTTPEQYYDKPYTENVYDEDKCVYFVPDDNVEHSKVLNILYMLEDNKYSFDKDATYFRWSSDDQGLECGEFSEGIFNNRNYSTEQDFINLFGRNYMNTLDIEQSYWNGESEPDYEPDSDNNGLYILRDKLYEWVNNRGDI